MANNDDYAEISHNLLNKDELIEKFGWEEYFVFALMLGVRFFFFFGGGLSFSFISSKDSGSPRRSGVRFTIIRTSLF